MSERLQLHVRGQPLAADPFHYTLAGLDDVYLLNGFEIEEDPHHGRLVSFTAQDDLHRAIGLSIVKRERLLTGPEIRYLRRHMKESQAVMSEALGCSDQTVANYEKGSTEINKSSDLLLRIRFMLSVMPENMRASFLKQHLAGLNAVKPVQPDALAQLDEVRARRRATSEAAAESRKIARSWEESSEPELEAC